MYQPVHHDADPGPSSRLGGSARRPWSPFTYEEYQPDTRGIYDHLGHGRNDRAQRGSEDSVEALDLADYSRTLRRPTSNLQSPYPPFPHTSHVHPFSVPTPVHVNASPPYPEYPPSPDTDRPFSSMSRSTFAHAPPSLVSGSTHDSHDSSRRPHSLPPFLADVPQIRGPPIFSPSGYQNTLSHRPTSPVIEEEDISRFPAFSRTWYDDPRKSSRHSSLPPYSEPRYDWQDTYPPFPSAQSSSRGVLPWGSQFSDTDGPTVDDSVRADRMELLEAEFGARSGGNVANDEPMIGSVDGKGALITVGPKKRAGARWAQGILAVGATASSLYGALFIKPKPPAPPESRLPAFVLYGLSIITLILIFYLFMIRPLCCVKRRKPQGPGGPTAGGMMVLPVQGPPNGKKKKKPKKGKQAGGDSGSVQVNLIVDPNMFGGGRRDDEGHGSEDEFGSQPSAPRRRPRRGYFEGVELEREWTAARTFVKRMIFVDVACSLAWAAGFVLILLGKKCPPGAFNGWCDSYNIGTAIALLLCFAYGFSVFFGIVDLHMSKSSPRTRT